MDASEAQIAAEPGYTDAVDTREISLVFCDIVGSSRFTEQLGDYVSYRVVKGCQALVAALGRREAGELLEVRGDGFLLAFDTPAAATRCSVEIQRALATTAEIPLRVRIGVHTGEAIHDRTGYYGHTVIAAFRVSSLAQPDEILISDATRRRLPKLSFRLGRSRNVRLKGFERRYRVWQIRWRDVPGANRSSPVSSGALLRIARVGPSAGDEPGATAC